MKVKVVRYKRIPRLIISQPMLVILNAVVNLANIFLVPLIPSRAFLGFTTGVLNALIVLLTTYEQKAPPAATTPPKPKGWYPSTWLLAQDAHFGWGLALAFGVGIFSLGYLWIVILLVGERVIKEYVVDQLLIEKDPLIWDGLVDWAFYIMGAAVGYGLIRLFLG